MPKKYHHVALMPSEKIESKIYLLRNKKVMLDRDLAILYGVETRSLNQAVKRNLERFPEDFMFQLTKEETQNWISQIVISNKERMGLRKMPYAFTDLGISMLSSVLNSKTAILVNIQIMRTFARIKQMLVTNELLRQRMEELEKKYREHDDKIKQIFDVIRQALEEPAPPPKRTIGFHAQ